MSEKGVIAGVGIHPFGRFGDKPYEQMGFEAVDMALKDANIDFKEIQAAFVSKMYLPATAGVRILSLLGRTSIPIVDVEAACAGSGACLKMGANAIAAGEYDIVLAMGIDKMPRGLMDPRNMFQLWQCYAGLSQYPMYVALEARRHMHDYGTTIEQIAKVAVKNHKNAVHNPNALYRKAMTMEEVMNSPLICDPLRLFMMCSPDEGAVATILVSPKVAKRYTTHPITLAACAHRVSMIPLPHGPLSTAYPTANPPVGTLAAREAYETSGIGPEDLDCALVQDGFASLEIEFCEQLLFCKEGEGGKLIDDGVTEIGGKLPVNFDGGVLCKGEPPGATGLGQIYEMCIQLRGEAGLRQVDGAKVGLCHITGSMGHCTVTILKK